MPMHPGVYADLLSDKMSQHGSTAWLINTGWSGGPLRCWEQNED